MQRRKLFQYSALSSASFLINFELFNHKSTAVFGFKNIMKKQLYDWIVLYWMPYDNNLSRFCTPIIEMLKSGIQSNNILVVVQAKISGINKIIRFIITLNNINSQRLETSDSSSEEVFTEYLNWATLHFQAKKWAIVVLGHGGSLDQISPDEHPFSANDSMTKWMNIQKLSNSISNFNNQIDNPVELFFFQNCNKGTIEANYTFRDTAKYTLSSQLTLGAPNYYYKPLLEFIGRNPQIHGGELATKIVEFEPINMYHSYTVVNNRAVHHLPEKINPLIESIISSDLKGLKPSELITYNYMNERYVDIISFFKTISEQVRPTQQKYNEFVEFLNNSMIYKVQKGGTLLGLNEKYEKFSGLGMFFPKNKQELEKYRYLQVFSDLKLLDIITHQKLVHF